MKKLVSLLFHRLILVAAAIVLQLVVLLLVILQFDEYFIYFYWFSILLSLVAVVRIVGSRGDPAYKIAWIVPILLFPLMGWLLYLLFGGNRLSNRTRRKMEGVRLRTIEALQPDCNAEMLRSMGPDAVNQSRYLECMACCPAYGNTDAAYFSAGELFFPRFLEELRRAEHYIFMEYFIITPGKLWDSVLEILADKAAAGVDVRVIYDDIGCILTLPRHYDKVLEGMGIKCSIFNPFVPVLSTRLNNRSHRKLCVIDGVAGFTGGVNLADEYINEVERYGYWKDSAILLRGEAVWSMTVMFLTMWEYVRGVREDYEVFRPPQLPRIELERCGAIQPYTDNPLDDEPVSETVYLNLINKAERYVYITTPYLILADTMRTALCNAAKSGVDVRIMTPGIPDKRTVFELTKAHYEPLLEAGISIYEFSPGFLHAKNFVVDDKFATVGSINLDYRSLFLHFENGVWLCGSPAVYEVKADFLATQAQCRMVTLEEFQNIPMRRKLLRSILRIFAPLM